MSEEAGIHGRWHRALDDLSAEPDGPIRDHIEAHDAQVRRDLAAKVEALCAEVSEATHGSLDAASSFGGALVGAVNIYSDGFDRIRALLADALPQDADSEPASVPTTAREGGNGQDHAGEGERPADRRTAAQAGYPEVRRVFTERGSHIEPPLEQDCSDLEKLRWHAAVVAVDAGVRVLVHQVDSRAYSIQVGSGSMGGMDFHRAWLYMVGITHGAEAAKGRR